MNQNDDFSKDFEPLTKSVKEWQILLENASSIHQTTQAVLLQTAAMQERLNQQLQVSFSPTVEAFQRLANSVTATVNESMSLSIEKFLDALRESHVLTPPVLNGFRLKEDSDYVIVSAPEIKEHEFPNEIVVPIGNHRFKIKTSLFLTIIGLIINIFSGMGQSQNEAMKIQNQILIQIFNTVDYSTSDKAQDFIYLKEYLEGLNSAPEISEDSKSQSPETDQVPDSSESSPDSNESSDCTASEN